MTSYETGLRISPGSLPNTEAGTLALLRDGLGPAGRRRRPGRTSASGGPPADHRRHPGTRPKGRTITVRGKLTRANWDTLHYGGYGKQTVELQWRSPNGSYHLVKRVTGAVDGTVRATVKAGQDGCFRFVFKGNGSTAPVIGQGRLRRRPLSRPRGSNCRAAGPGRGGKVNSPPTSRRGRSQGRRFLRRPTTSRMMPTTRTTIPT